MNSQISRTELNSMEQFLFLLNKRYTIRFLDENVQKKKSCLKKTSSHFNVNLFFVCEIFWR